MLGLAGQRAKADDSALGVGGEDVAADQGSGVTALQNPDAGPAPEPRAGPELAAGQRAVAGITAARRDHDLLDHEYAPVARLIQVRGGPPHQSAAGDPPDVELRSAARGGPRGDHQAVGQHKLAQRASPRHVTGPDQLPGGGVERLDNATRVAGRTAVAPAGDDEAVPDRDRPV